MTSPDHNSAHRDEVAAYAIGALDPAEAARLEEHLAVCQPCATELDELIGLGPLLAEHAASASPPGEEEPSGSTPLVPRPSSRVLDRLLDAVVVDRRRRRRWRLSLAASAVALIIAAPFAGATLLDGDGDRSSTGPTDRVRAMFDGGEQFTGTDPRSEVDATVSLRGKRWGTEVAVRLAGVSGPRTCGLVAVGKDGSEQTVTTWAVPDSGYSWDKPVYYLGGAGYDQADIDRFEVRTLDGEHLVTVDK